MSLSCLKPIPMTHNGRGIFVRCGKCINCKKAHSVEWSYRIMLEKSLYDDSEVHFITLTYNNENLPPYNSLRKSDIQKFMKRVRKKYTIRYAGTGEYGARRKRPHYHFILFGLKLCDKSKFYEENGITYYRSKTIEKFWTLGFSLVAEVNEKTAMYVNKYLQKFNFSNDTEIMKNQEKPFFLSSRKPPIGVPAFQEDWLKDDKIYINGRYHKIPRAILRIIEKEYDVSDLKSRRVANCSFDDDLWIKKSVEYSKIKLKYKKDFV